MSFETTICKWKDNKKAAYSISGDDSLHSHLDFMIPQMQKRGFKATFWINPGRGAAGETGFCWQSRNAEWLEAAKSGFDFANHTLHHTGAKTIEEADWEIGESMRIIQASNPGQILQLFLRGGGTTWLISREEIQKIVEKYQCVTGRGGGVEDVSWHGDTGLSATAEELTASVDRALSEGSWRLAACHGTGPKAEWLPTDEGPFLTLLDYLYSKRNLIWVDNNTTIHKYITEFSSACVNILDSGENTIKISLGTKADPILYDIPLTLVTKVPENWESCLVTCGGKSFTVPVNSGSVQYDAMPDLKEIMLQRK